MKGDGGWRRPLEDARGLKETQAGSTLALNCVLGFKWRAAFNKIRVPSTYYGAVIRLLRWV